jgi:hypothetical protein
MLPEDLYILRAHAYKSMRNSRIKRRISRLGRFCTVDVLVNEAQLLERRAQEGQRPI